MMKLYLPSRRGVRADHLLKPWLVLILLSVVPFLFNPASSLAQHPIEVQRYSANGEHLKALATYRKMPRRKISSDAVLAAGKSAWALSLPEVAIVEFEKVLLDKGVSADEKARTYLSRGIIEYQEGRYRVAALYAEKMVTSLQQAGPLRSVGWLVWGDSLYELKSYGAAETKYLTALEEAAPEATPDIHYRLGLCSLRLGNLEAAGEHFQHVPLNHERTADAIRHLAHIALEGKLYQHASFWLERGRAEFPDRFLDSWVDYALVRAALEQGEIERARKLRGQATQKYPPSDHWLTMLNAISEVHEWKTGVQ